MDGEFNAINANNVKPHVREIGYSKSEKDNIVNSSRHFTSLVLFFYCHFSGKSANNNSPPCHTHHCIGTQTHITWKDYLLMDTWSMPK